MNNIVSKARQRIDILFCGFLSRNLSTLRRDFITYICPVLEYNSITCNPTFIYLIELIENVQRNYTKRKPSQSSISYSVRLASQDLKFLELLFDLICNYKVGLINYLTPLEPCDEFTIYVSAAHST
jgi:hypothetical protein